MILFIKKYALYTIQENLIKKSCEGWLILSDIGTLEYI